MAKTTSDRDATIDFEALFKSAPSLFIVMDPDLKIVAASEAYLEACNIKRDQVVGRSFFEVFPPILNDPDTAAIEKIKASLHKVLETHARDDMGIHKHDHRWRKYEDGEVEEKFWSSVNVPIFSEDQKTIRYIIRKVEDVTEAVHLFKRGLEQSKITEELRENEGRFRLMAEVMPQMVWTVRSNGKVDYCNQRYFEYTGFPFSTNEEDLSKWDRALHPDDREMVAEIWKSAFSSRAPLEMENRLRRGSDGTYRWHLVRAVPVFNSEGQLLKWLGTSTDIDDQKRLEESLRTRVSNEHVVLRICKTILQVPPGEMDAALQEALKELGEIADVDRSYIWMYSDGIKYADITQEWCREGVHSLKNSSQSIPSRGFTWSVGLLLNHEAICINDLADLPDEAEMELDYLKSRGVKSVLAVPMFQSESLIGVLGFDVFRSKRIWNSEDVTLLEIAAEIFVNALRRSGAEAALIRQAEALKRSNADLEQFAYITSHDLKEPIRTVGLYAELLQKQLEGKIDDPTRSSLQTLVQASNRMHQLVSDVLAYSRVAKQEFFKERIQSKEVVEVALSNLERTIIDSGAEIILGDLPMVKGDRLQLMQVFQNLLSNALRYRSEATPKIEIRSRREGEEWIFEIQDNGIGIDPRFFNKIFRIFQRLHGPEKGEGTGIGLALAKKIIERHGGRIWIESTPQKGSTFYFSLPAEDGPAQARHKVATQETNSNVAAI